MASWGIAEQEDDPAVDTEGYSDHCEAGCASVEMARLASTALVVDTVGYSFYPAHLVAGNLLVHYSDPSPRYSYRYVPIVMTRDGDGLLVSQE